MSRENPAAREIAPAKLNLALHVRGKLPDGRLYVASERVESAVTLEALVGRDGPLSPERARAIVLQVGEALTEAQKVGRTGDGAIAGQIVTNLNLGRTFAHTAAEEKRLNALTPEEIAAAFRKHIDPKKLVIVRAGDFKK